MSPVISLLKSALTWDFAIQGTGFLIAALIKKETLYDILGSTASIVLAYKSLQWGKSTSPRQKIQTSCAIIWATRLGLYLFTRILQDGQDRRFSKIREDPKMFFVAWMMQGVWVFSNLLPTLIQNAKRNTPEVGAVEYTGWAVWLVGFIIEVVADYQKSSFRANPENKGKFIATGLWYLSRHPNFFGEILMWSGLYISAFRSLEGWEHIGVASPLFSAFLLTKVSGIPMLERYGVKKWGSNPDYQKYLRETPVLVPNLFKLFKK